MKLKYKDLVTIVNDIALVIDDVLELANKDVYGKCMASARITHDELKARGIPCRIAGGRAAFSFNKGRFGIIDYGYDEKPAIAGKKIGHFWIVTGDYVVDPTLRFLKEEAWNDDMMRGLPPSQFLLDDRMVVRKRDLSTFKQLHAGKLGWHYDEIPGRSELVWSGKPSELAPASV